MFEQYRKLYYEGMRITPKSLFQEKARVWKVAEATWDGVDDAIEEWESKLELLDEHGKYQMDEEDRIHGLLEIVPTELRLNFLEEQEKGNFNDYWELKEDMQYRVTAHNENRGTAAKRGNGVAWEEDLGEQGEDWQEEGGKKKARQAGTNQDQLPVSRRHTIHARVEKEQVRQAEVEERAAEKEVGPRRSRRVMAREARKVKAKAKEKEVRNKEHGNMGKIRRLVHSPERARSREQSSSRVSVTGAG